MIHKHKDNKLNAISKENAKNLTAKIFRLHKCASAHSPKDAASMHYY